MCGCEIRFGTERRKGQERVVRNVRFVRNRGGVVLSIVWMWRNGSRTVEKGREATEGDARDQFESSGVDRGGVEGRQGWVAREDVAE